MIAQAQDGSVTKQDALDFINKMYKDFPQNNPAYNETISDYTEIARLDGSKLTVELKWTSQTTYVKWHTVFDHSYIFDLSKLYDEDGTVIPTTNNAIEMIFINTDYNKNGSQREKPQVFLDNYLREFNMFTITHVGDPEYRRIYGQNGEHFIKALEFLIQACGGGNKPAAPKEKF